MKYFVFSDLFTKNTKLQDNIVIYTLTIFVDKIADCIHRKTKAMSINFLKEELNDRFTRS